MRFYQIFLRFYQRLSETISMRVLRFSIKFLEIMSKFVRIISLLYDMYARMRF